MPAFLFWEGRVLMLVGALLIILLFLIARVSVLTRRNKRLNRKIYKQQPSVLHKFSDLDKSLDKYRDGK